MEIIYSRSFVDRLKDANNIIRLFSCSFLKVDNSYTKEELMKKVRVHVDNSTDRLNDNTFIVELGMDSISNSEYLVDGVQFGTYNRIELRYDYSLGNDQWITDELAGYIEINKSGANIFDYARNFIYIDLSVFPVNAKILLKKISVDNGDTEMYGVIIDHKHTLLTEIPTESASVKGDNTVSFDVLRKSLVKKIKPPRSSRSNGFLLSNLRIEFSEGEN